MPFRTSHICTVVIFVSGTALMILSAVLLVAAPSIFFELDHNEMQREIARTNTGRVETFALVLFAVGFVITLCSIPLGRYLTRLTNPGEKPDFDNPPDPDAYPEIRRTTE